MGYSDYFNLSLLSTCVLSALSIVCTILGSTAPDYLEIRYRKKVKNKKGKLINTSVTVLPHRGITHTLSIWLVVSYMMHRLAFQVEDHNLTYLLFFSYSFGAVIHILGDLPNKKGVPLLPFCPKFCLKLWGCSQNERLTCFLLVLITGIVSVFYSEALYTQATSLYTFIEFQFHRD